MLFPSKAFVKYFTWKSIFTLKTVTYLISTNASLVLFALNLLIWGYIDFVT